MSLLEITSPIVRQESSGPCQTADFTLMGSEHASLADFKEYSFVLEEFPEDKGKTPIPDEEVLNVVEYSYTGGLISKDTRKGSIRLTNPRGTENVAQVKENKRQVFLFSHDPKDALYSNQAEYQNVINMNIFAPNKHGYMLREYAAEWVCGELTLRRWTHQYPLFILSSNTDNKILLVASFTERQYLDMPPSMIIRNRPSSSVYIIDEQHILVWNTGYTQSVLFFRNNKARPLGTLGTTIKTNNVFSNSIDFNNLYKNQKEAITEMLFKFVTRRDNFIDVRPNAEGMVFKVYSRNDDKLNFTTTYNGVQLSILCHSNQKHIHIQLSDPCRKLTSSILDLKDFFNSCK